MSLYSMQDAINEMVNSSYWKYRYQVIKLKGDWELLMGKTVAKHTKDLRIDNQKLYIITDVPALKQELSYNKTLLVARINQHFGEQFINEIIVS
jgi:hypothetical protein